MILNDLTLLNEIWTSILDKFYFLIWFKVYIIVIICP